MSTPHSSQFASNIDIDLGLMDLQAYWTAYFPVNWQLLCYFHSTFIFRGYPAILNHEQSVNRHNNQHPKCGDPQLSIISPVESLNWSPGNVVCPVSRSVPDWVLEAIRISDDINELVPSFSFPDAHIIFRFDIITHIQQ